MSTRLAASIIAVVWAVVVFAASVRGEVDLAWSPPVQTVAVGDVVEIGLLAVSNAQADQDLSAMDVVLTWDPTVLELQGKVDNGPYAWLMSSFEPDETLDGLNDSLLDGDAKYTALGNFSSPATATADGLLVTTLQFVALAPAESTQVVIEAGLGQYSFTQVFGTDYPNQDVTGQLGDAGVTVVTPPRLSVGDVAGIPGRTAYVVASGDIDGQSTMGMTVMVELVPSPGNTGAVTFTQAPPTDIIQLEDPWFRVGTFSPYDTDRTFSETLNGNVTDNGTYIPEPTFFSGPLAAFPVVATADAEGIWDVLLATSAGNSDWEGLPTVLTQGTLRIVSPGDHDGNGRVDLLEFSRFERCFSGSFGPVDPPAYAIGAGLSCGVFDFDADGDVDLVDYGEFSAMMGGPGP